MKNTSSAGLIAGAVIILLVIALVSTGFFASNRSSRLKEAETRIASMEANTASLEKQIASMVANRTDTELKLANAQADIKVLADEQKNLEADLQALTSKNQALIDELTKIKYPRHFNSLTELTNWLQKDDTNTNSRYANLTILEKGYILEVRALMDGYLLPVRMPMGGTTDYIVNTAVIGDTIYGIRVTDDYVDRWGSVQALPAHPIPVPP